MPSRDFPPASLGEIDEVSVVDLRGVKEPDRGSYMSVSDACPCVVLRGDDAQAIASLVRALPDGDMMRCHVPVYGLRFRHGSQAVLDVAMCWRCNNAFGTAAAEAVVFTFDGEAPESRVLLERLKVILPLEASRAAEDRY